MFKINAFKFKTIKNFTLNRCDIVASGLVIPRNDGLTDCVLRFNPYSTSAFLARKNEDGKLTIEAAKDIVSEANYSDVDNQIQGVIVNDDKKSNDDKDSFDDKGSSSVVKAIRSSDPNQKLSSGKSNNIIKESQDSTSSPNSTGGDDFNNKNSSGSYGIKPSDNNPLNPSHNNPKDLVGSSPSAPDFEGSKAEPKESGPNKGTYSEESDGHLTDDVEPTHLLDDNIIQSLDIVSESDDIENYAEASFINTCSIENKPKYPSEDLTHLKSSYIADAKTMSEASMDFKIGLFEDMQHKIVSDHVKLIKQFKPLDELKIKDLDRALLTANKVTKMPMAACLPYKNSLVAKGVLGSAQALQDLSPFVVSDYKECGFHLKFEGAIGQNASRTVVLTLVDDSGHTINKEFKYSDHPIALRLLEHDYKLMSNNSCFTTGTYKHILSGIYQINQTNSFTVSSSGSQERKMVATKSQQVVSFSDGFESVLTFDTGFTFSVREKCVVDMLSFFLMGGYNVDDDNLDHLVKYTATIMHNYFLKQMAIKEGAHLIKLDLNVKISRKNNCADKLHSLYVKGVRDGDIIPISPVQFMYYFDKSQVSKWRSFISAASIINVNQNPDVRAIMPTMTSSSRSNFVMYAKNKDLLITESYNNSDKFTFFKTQPKYVSYNDFIAELMIRQVSLDSIDLCYPMITRSQWKSELRKSLEVSPANIKVNFVKFNVDDAFNEVTKFHSNLMQLPRVHHVKRVCRLMEKKSGLTKLVLNSGNTTSRDITKFDLKDRTTW